MKKCTNCGFEKEYNEFYGKMGWCKTCHAIRMKEWVKNNPESVKKAWTKGNRKRNKGRICPYCGNLFKIATAQDGCSLNCRFHLSFVKSESGCWEWTRYKGGRKSYQAGHLWVNKKCRIASHISYELYKGPIKDGLMVLHICDNPCCVNPDHLYLGNHQQNMDDMNGRGRGNAGRLHFRKYDKDKCMQVFSLRNQGKLFTEISEITGIKLSSCKYIYANPNRIG